MALTSLLQIDIKKLLEVIEERSGIKLPQEVVEAYLDPETQLLHIRFAEPESTEGSEPLPFKAIVNLFIDDKTGKITALEIIGIGRLMKEIGN